MRFLNLIWLLLAIHFQLALAPDPLPAPSSSIFPSKPASKPKRPRPTKDTDFINKFKKFKVSFTNPVPVSTVEPFLYQGGSYGVLQDLCSKSKTIESDHAPHSSLLLQYLDGDTLSKLPKGTQLQTMMEKKSKLESDLKGTAFSANVENMKNLNKEIDILGSKLGDKMTAKERGKMFNDELAITQNKMKDLERENRILKKKPASAITKDDEIKLANFKNEQQKLQKRMDTIHSNAKAEFLKRSGLSSAEIEGNKAKLNSLKSEHANLEKVNKALAKPLNDHVDSMKGFMAVFSLPYETHRLFPSTGGAGLNEEIQALKNADAATAAKVKDEYDGYFKKNMELAKKKIQPGNVEVLKDANKFSDPQELYRHNLNEIIKGSQKYSNMPDPKPKSGKEYIMDLLHKSYAKKFTTSTIHALKTPGVDGSYAHLVSLFAAEYKAYLGAGVFEGDAKAGLQKWLEANKNFGVLTDADLAKLKNDFKLNDADIPPRNPTDQRVILQQAIEEKDAKRKQKWDDSTKKAESSGSGGFGSDAVCSGGSLGRRKRSAGGSACIFSCEKCRKIDIDNELDDGPKKQNIDDSNPSKSKGNENLKGGNEDMTVVKNKLGEDQALPKPKIDLPQDLDTTKVDATNLNKLLSQKLPDTDVESFRTKNAIVDHAIKNQEKLSGSPDEVAKAKALLQMENVHAQSLQAELVTKLAHSSDTGDIIPAKSLTQFGKVKVGMKTFGKKLGKFAIKAGKKFQGAYGKIMLAKGVTSAIRHGDTESIVFIGGRIGLEYGLNAYSKFGKTIAGSLGFAKSGAKLIGKIAGPLGDILDIAWNGYMISKSVSILNDPNASKFDKNDAIADIVGNAIDIAVTSVALVLSIAFPGLGTVIAGVAFVINLLATIAVGFFKAQNQVDRLNEELPLLDFEKGQEYWRYVVGKDTSGYIQEIIDTKRANNYAVNGTLHFLKNNTDYIGRVFPSRTLFDPNAPCYLQRKHDKKLFWFITVSSKNWTTVSKCKGEGGYCEGEYSKHKCESKSDSEFLIIGGKEYEYRCRCGDPPPDGYEILDSEVDFRKKRTVYLDRSGPDMTLDTGFEYQCKPSTLTDLGPRVSNPEASFGYLCKGAMSVRRSNLKGKFMLYDLGNGRDSVYLDSFEEIDNLFIVKNGHKDFSGNGGDDTFLMDGYCRVSGILDGGGAKPEGGNVLIIGDDCDMNVDLTGKGKLKFRNFHRVIGRHKKADRITVGCDTRHVDGKSGYAGNPDRITLSSCGKSHEVVVAGQGYTELNASRFSAGNAYILLSKTNETSLDFKAIVPTIVEGTILFKFDKSLGSLSSEIIGKHDKAYAVMLLYFENVGRAWFEFYGEPRSTILTEQCDSVGGKGNGHVSIEVPNGLMTCQLAYNLEKRSAQAVHQLKIGSNLTSVKGYDFLENIWHLESGQWEVIGGKSSNQFVLKSSQFSGHLIGGFAQYLNRQSSFNLMNDLGVQDLHVDFGEGLIKDGEGYNVTFTNITGLTGRPDYVENVTTSCITRSLDLGGAVRDYVFVPELDCNNELVITVKGKVEIKDWRRNGTTIVQAGYDICSGVPLELSLSTKDSDGRTTLLLNYPVHKLKYIEGGKLEIGDGNKVELDLRQAYFEEGESLKSVLVYEQKKWVSFHELSNSSQPGRIRSGADTVENVFKLESGDWLVNGGEMDDSFNLVGKDFKGRLDGMGGTNKLIIGDGINQTLEITENEILTVGQGSLLYKNIHQIIGRQEAQELIQVNCDIQQVALGGGDLHKPDRVVIQDKNCWTRVTIVGAGYTEFESDAGNGTFDIYLIPDHANNLKFRGSVKAETSTVFFNLPIRLPSYQLRAYTVTKEEELHNTIVFLKLEFLENDNFIYMKWIQNATNYDSQMRSSQMLFVDEEAQSNGNIIVDGDSKEVSVLHVLQTDAPEKRERKGAIGAKNIFRLHNGTWDAYGGKLDDSFIINSNQFNGTIQGLGGVNSLVLTEFLNETGEIEVDLANKTVTFDGINVIKAHNIQIVGGRKWMMDKVICACNTKLVMLEGGVEDGKEDNVRINNPFCNHDLSIVLEKFTNVDNNATRGNFTYHVRSAEKFKIDYYPGLETNHEFKFEMDFEEIANVSLQTENELVFLIHFVEQTEPSSFPLNSQNLPTFHFGTGQELTAELTFGQGLIPNAAIFASSPYSGKVLGFSGAENQITLNTGQAMEGIWGGDEDDIFFLNDVKSILVINGGKGANRLQLGEELYQGLGMNVDLFNEEITFTQTQEVFATLARAITQFVGRDNGFERVVLACSTEGVAEVEEVIIPNLDCNFHVKIEIGLETRVIFTEENKADKADEMEITEEIFAEDEDIESKLMERISTFHYHFSIIRSFDIEFEISPDELGLTRHIFYFNFSLSDLGSISFFRNESRLVYSIMDKDMGLYKDYSHLLGGVDEFEMDYFQPEFMTNEGLLVRITRYGEVMGVIGNQEEILDLETLQNEMIPRLAAFSLRLGIGFVIETLSDFVFCSAPTINNEPELINNRANVTSHLIGWNLTSYEILDLDKDVYIYPQGLQNDSIHIIDLTVIIAQIRKPGEINYVPEVIQNGSDLEILMTNWTESFPNKIVLVNGTSQYKKFVVLLNSIGMDLHPVEALRTTKRSVSEGEREVKWILKPQPILVPDGHTFLYSASDLEDDVEIRGVEPNKEDDKPFHFAKKDTNLIMTNVGNGSATSLIIMDYYTPTFLSFDLSDNVAEKMRNVHIRFRDVKVELNSGQSLTDTEGNPISVEYYDDILERSEEAILADFTDISRQYKIPLSRKIWRLFGEYWDWCAVLIGVLGVGIFSPFSPFLLSKRIRKYDLNKWRMQDDNSIKLNKLMSVRNGLDDKCKLNICIENEKRVSVPEAKNKTDARPGFGDVKFISCRNVHLKGSSNSGSLSDCRNCLLLSTNSRLNIAENSNVNITLKESELDSIKSNHLQLSGNDVRGRLRDNRNCNLTGENCKWECDSNANLGVKGNDNKLKLRNNYNLQVDGNKNEIWAEGNSHLRISGDGNDLFVKGTSHHSIKPSGDGQTNFVEVKLLDSSLLPDVFNGILHRLYIQKAIELQVKYVRKGRIDGGKYSLGIFNLEVVKGLDFDLLVSIFTKDVNSFEIVENINSEIVIEGRRGNLKQSLKLKAKSVEVAGESEGTLEVKLNC